MLGTHLTGELCGVGSQVECQKSYRLVQVLRTLCYRECVGDAEHRENDCFVN